MGTRRKSSPEGAHGLFNKCSRHAVYEVGSWDAFLMTAFYRCAIVIRATCGALQPKQHRRIYNRPDHAQVRVPKAWTLT